MDEIKKIRQEIQINLESIPAVLFNSSFDSIFDLIDTKEVMLNIPKYNINNTPAMLSHSTRGFILETEGLLTDGKDEMFEIEILSGDKVWKTDDFHISMRSSHFERTDSSNKLSGKFRLSFHIHSLCNCINEGDVFYWRYVIATDGAQLNYYANTMSYRDESMVHFMGKLPIKIGNNSFNLYEKKFGEKYYFIIDAEQSCKLGEFSDSCFSILLAFGFLSSDLFQDEAFCLASTSPKFEASVGLKYNVLRPSIRSHGSCNPIYSNPYAYTKDDEIIDKIGKELPVFDDELFSALCDKLYSNQEYAALVLTIIESNVTSLVLRPAGYSVALEKITNIIAEENKGLKPIPDKKLAGEFLSKLQEVLESFKERIDPSGKSDSVTILRKKIQDLNSPTNRDKLTKPFSIYKIPLTKEDINAVDNRNSFLHGRSLQIEEGSSDFLAIWAISMRLNKLVNKLILKHIGYSGYVINHLKHNERSFPQTINEDLFEPL